MKIVVIDGQGGGIGRQLVARLRERMPAAEIFAVGANSVATSAMLKAGASSGATGENAVIVACRRASVIVGPVGEITPAMAAAVARSAAKRVLIPFNFCDNVIVGVSDYNVANLVKCAVDEVASLAAAEG